MVWLDLVPIFIRNVEIFLFPSSATTCHRSCQYRGEGGDIYKSVVPSAESTKQLLELEVRSKQLLEKDNKRLQQEIERLRAEYERVRTGEGGAAASGDAETAASAASAYNHR